MIAPMDGEYQISNAFRNAQKWSSPHWRWDRAAWIWARRRRRRHLEDKWTLRAIPFHMPQKSRRRRLDPAISQAWQIHQQDGETRWELEALVLANVDPGRIAKRLGIPPGVVEVFEAVFFDARGSLTSLGWLKAHIFTWSVNDPDPKPIRQIWAEAAFGMGERGLNAAIALTTGRGLGMFSEEELEEYELAFLIEQLPTNDLKRLTQLYLRIEACTIGAHPSCYHMPRTSATSQGGAIGAVRPSRSCRSKPALSPITRGGTKDPCRTTKSHSDGPMESGSDVPLKLKYRYKVCRINGKPRRIYLGSGLFGRIHELLDRREKRKLLQNRLARTTFEARIEAAEAALGMAMDKAQRVFDATMVLSGHYRHGGQWRPVRGEPRTRQHRQIDPWEKIEDPFARLAAVTTASENHCSDATEELRHAIDDNSPLWSLVDAESGRAHVLWRDLAAERTGMPDQIDHAAEHLRQRLLDKAASPAERLVSEVLIAAQMKRTFADSLEKATGARARLRLKLLQSSTRQMSRLLGWIARLERLTMRCAPAGSPSKSMPDSCDFTTNVA